VFGKGVFSSASNTAAYLKGSTEQGYSCTQVKLGEFRRRWSRESERATLEWSMAFPGTREVKEIGKGSTGVVKLYEELSTN
jgi:hypothetical protein